MEKIHIPAEKRTPELIFDFDQGIFQFIGESYPENIDDFYSHPISQFQDWLEGSLDQDLEAHFKLIYFNSSSAKVVMEFLDAVEESAQKGRKCHIKWFHLKDDDNIKELGEEFASDMSATVFELCEID
jgi:hypothetical protein